MDTIAVCLVCFCVGYIFGVVRGVLAVHSWRKR